MEPGRRLAAERLDQLHRARSMCNLVSVVDDEDEISAERRLKRLADERRDAPRPGRLVRLGSRAACTRDGAGDLRRHRRNPQPQRVDDAPCERRERGILGRGAVPRAVDSRRPVGEQRRLAEARVGDDDRQPPLERLVEAHEQPFAPEEGGRGDWGHELRRRGRRGGLCHARKRPLVPSSHRPGQKDTAAALTPL